QRSRSSAENEAARPGLSHTLLSPRVSVRFRVPFDMRPAEAQAVPVTLQCRMRRMTLRILWAGAALALTAAARPAQPGGPFDVLIRNGRVMDGTGNPWIQADLGIRGGRIAAMGRLAGATAQTTIDAAGLLVTPGFIDVHSHAAEGLARPELQQGQPLLAQGITTIVGNPDGGGPVDLAAQRARLEKQRVGVNVALLIGHGSVRSAVIGPANRAPTAAE